MEIKSKMINEIFATNFTTDNMKDYLRAEYVSLKRKHNNRTEIEERRFLQLENDPSTKIFAMRFNDNEFKSTTYREYGAVYDAIGQYTVVGDKGTFNLSRGDVLFINSSDKNRLEDEVVQVMDRETFKRTYVESYNF